jgi:pimeloyl-ACP methyl ester carboxylesterase
VNGHRIAYTEKGEGKPLLLIHGYGGASVIWEYQIPVLARTRRVFALDLPGHGQSDKPHIDYTPEVFIRGVEGFLEAMKIEDAALIGHSMGGAIAQVLAARQPERISRLILMAPLSPDSSPGTLLLKALYSLRKVPLIQKGYLSLPGTLATKISLGYMVFNKNLITEDVLLRFHALRRVEGYAYAMISIPRHFEKWKAYAGEIPKIVQPTLILWGEEDRYLSVKEGTRINHIVPHSRLVVLPGVGHLPMWESASRVNREIENFLENGAETRGAV